jgi:5-hydroxyisourate hydrolase-like protein (transthyretin family)
MGSSLEGCDRVHGGGGGGWGIGSRFSVMMVGMVLIALCQGVGCSGSGMKIDLSKLTVDQLRLLHQQLQEEEGQLAQSYQRLRVASNGFYDARQAVK